MLKGQHTAPRCDTRLAGCSTLFVSGPTGQTPIRQSWYPAAFKLCAHYLFPVSHLLPVTDIAPNTWDPNNSVHGDANCCVCKPAAVLASVRPCLTACLRACVPVCVSAPRNVCLHACVHAIASTHPGTRQSLQATGTRQCRGGCRAGRGQPASGGQFHPFGGEYY